MKSLRLPPAKAGKGSVAICQRTAPAPATPAIAAQVDVLGERQFDLSEDQLGKLVGVLSTADVLTAQAESGAGAVAWEGMAVRDVMGSPALTIEPDARLHDAAQQMLYGNVHRLFVVEDGDLVGVISQTDVVRAMATMRPHL